VKSKSLGIAEGFWSVEKVFFTAKTDKSTFCIAFSCGRRGTAVAVDEEKN
jgi:hypothetical protein